MTQLENNTSALQEILAAVNALPNAGSGGGEVNKTSLTQIFSESIKPSTTDGTLTVNHNTGIMPLVATVTISSAKPKSIRYMVLIKTDTGVWRLMVYHSSSTSSIYAATPSIIEPEQWDDNTILFDTGTTSFSFSSSYNYTVTLYA